MTTNKSNPQEFYAKDRGTWRNWLKKYHDKVPNVRLLLYRKNSTKQCVTYEEAVEEALCYGWIDGRANKRDDESFFIFFSERKPKGNWSAINKKRITKLKKQGLMTEAGLAKIEAAKKNGSWTNLDNIDQLKMPADLQKVMAKNKKAEKFFEAFPPSAKKIIFMWIENAKTPATREKRLSETVTSAARNKRANQPNPKA